MISAVLFIIAGVVGALPVDIRIAWILVAVAGAFMLVPLP